jgi:hypothetical protein
MKQLGTIIIAFALTSCWVHRDITSYQTIDSEKLNNSDYQIEFKITKDYKHRTFPFLFVEKSGKKNSWSITTSFTTPQTRIKSISADLTITNQKGEIIFEGKEKKVELIAFEGYNAKGFDFGSFERDLQRGKEDTLIATYKVNFVGQPLSSHIDTSYLVLSQEKRTGSFF